MGKTKVNKKMFENIKDMLKSEVKQKDIATFHNLSASTVNKISVSDNLFEYQMKYRITNKKVKPFWKFWA
jgi:hypothetical protein